MKCFALVVIVCIHQAFGRSLPIILNLPDEIPKNHPSRLPRQDIIGGWIQSSEWFPIEVNIPDTLSAIGNGVSSGFMNVSQAFGNWIQQFPFFNRITSPFKPRPLPVPMKYVLFMPFKRNGQIDFSNISEDNLIVYP